MRIRFSLLALPLVFLAACGGASDSDQIRDIVEQGSSDPKSVCSNLTDQGLKDLGGKDACEKLAGSQDNTDPDVEINSIEVDGDKATAKVTGKDGAQTIRFVKEDGDWRVSPG
jgi:hypothetical protein